MGTCILRTYMYKCKCLSIGIPMFFVLCSVIRRLISMLSQTATLDASHTAAVRQAQAANAELTRRIDAEVSITRCVYCSLSMATVIKSFSVCK